MSDAAARDESGDAGEQQRERERERERERGREGERERGGREKPQTFIHWPPQQRRLLRRNLALGRAEYGDGLLGTKRRERVLPYMTSSA